MNITFNNIGAVKKVSIDLTKKLNVFCGPNNTGKTYIAYAIYGLLRSSLSKFKVFVTAEQVQEFIEKGIVRIKLKEEDVDDYRKRLVEAFDNNLSNIFGLSKSDTEKVFKDASVGFDTSNGGNKSVDAGFSAIVEALAVGGKIELIKKKGDDFATVKLNDTAYKNFDVESYKFQLSHLLYGLIVKYPVTYSHILPVERNSIYTFSKELSLKRNELFEQLQNFASKENDLLDWLERRTTRYPLAIRDGLGIADDLENFSKREGEYARFADEIEKEILDGVISTSRDGDVLFTSNKAKGKKLPIHLSASVVKTLSNLTFYLRHLAKQGELIIIDEPELNLHPDNQIKLTRIFAKLINNGFRLLISTHSDYIIRELNNLIMLSEDNDTIKDLAKEYGYGMDEKITPKDVDAHLFAYTSKTKVNVEKLEVGDTGFEIDSINEVINNLNQRSEELYYYLKEGDDEYSE